MPTDFSANSAQDFRRDEPEAEAIFGETPIYAQRTRKASTARKVPMAALVAIPAAVIAIGGVAYYMTQPRSTEVAEIAPPVVAPPAAVQPMTPAEPLAVNPTPTPLMQEAPATPTARVSAPQADTPRRATTRLAQAPRTRPAAPAASADDMGVDTSATVPAGPVPYSSLPDAVTAPAPSPEPSDPMAPAEAESTTTTAPVPGTPVNPTPQVVPVP